MVYTMAECGMFCLYYDFILLFWNDSATFGSQEVSRCPVTIETGACTYHISWFVLEKVVLGQNLLRLFRVSPASNVFIRLSSTTEEMLVWSQLLTA